MKKHLVKYYKKSNSNINEVEIKGHNKLEVVLFMKRNKNYKKTHEIIELPKIIGNDQNKK